MRLTVPSGWMVGATGREQSRTDNGNGTTTHRYTQDDVHDFAWTTSPDFLEMRQRFEEPGLPAVDMRLLLQPEHRDQADRHFAAVRATLKHYGQWFGPYPYGHLTVVDPVTVFNPDAQGASTGGMEYPTLVTAGTRWVVPWKGSEPERRHDSRSRSSVLARRGGHERGRARVDGRGRHHLRDRARDRRGVSGQVRHGGALLRRARPVALSGCPLVARRHGKSSGDLSTRAGLGRGGNADVACTGRARHDR